MVFPLDLVIWQFPLPLALWQGAGLTTLEAVVLSFTNLTSAGQFAGLGIITAGSSLVEMAMAQLIINLRYCLMSVLFPRNWTVICHFSPFSYVLRCNR